MTLTAHLNCQAERSIHFTALSDLSCLPVAPGAISRHDERVTADSSEVDNMAPLQRVIGIASSPSGFLTWPENSRQCLIKAATLE